VAAGVTAIGLAVALAAIAAAGSMAHAVDLPDAACNAGTDTAHASIPAETGSGMNVPGHAFVPTSGEDACAIGSDSG